MYVNVITFMIIWNKQNLDLDNFMYQIYRYFSIFFEYFFFVFKKTIEKIKVSMN